MTPPVRRVLVVGPSLRYLGGQAVQAQRLVEGLCGVPDVEVRYLEVDPRLPDLLGLLQGVPIIRTMLTSAAYLLTLIRHVPRCDVVHAFSASYWSFLLAPTPAMLVGRLFGKRVLLNYHSGEADDHLTRWGWHARPLLRLADVIVVPTAYLVEVFRSHGFEAIPIANHIDADGLPFSDRAIVRPNVLSNRNFEAHYNVGAVLTAFGALQGEYPDATLTVVGDGSLRGTLQAQVRQLGLRNVTFTGPVQPSAMRKHYEDADLFANASLIDNMPLSVLEAYASGASVVTSDAGGIPWIAADGVTALVVAKGDTAALADAMLAVVRFPDAARERARAARTFVEVTYSWTAVCSEWVSVYRG